MTIGIVRVAFLAASGWCTTRDNHVYLQPDQIGRKVAETVELSVRISVFDDHVLTFEITEFAQLLSERLKDRVGTVGRVKSQRRWIIETATHSVSSRLVRFRG